MGTINHGPRKGVPQVASPLVPGTLPAPDELAPDEAMEWRRFTGSMPPNWFTPETQPMLASLCRHVVMSRWIADQLQEVRAGSLNVLETPSRAPEYGTKGSPGREPREPTALEVVDKLLAMHAREVRQIALLMIKLRLTPQVRHLEETAREARATRLDMPKHRPWQPAEESPDPKTLS
jgi:hypothetical protein